MNYRLLKISKLGWHTLSFPNQGYLAVVHMVQVEKVTSPSFHQTEGDFLSKGFQSLLSFLRLAFYLPMHQSLLIALSLLLAVSLLVTLGDRLRISTPIFLVLCGLAISLIPGIPLISVEPDLIFLLFLPPLTPQQPILFNIVNDIQRDITKLLDPPNHP